MSIIPGNRGFKVEEQNYSLMYEDTVYEDDYYHGSSMQMMKPNHHNLGHAQNHGHVYGGYNEGRKGHDGHHYETNHHLLKHGHDQSHGHVYGGYNEGKKERIDHVTEHYKTNNHFPKYGHDHNYGRVYGGHGEKGRKGHESHMTEHYEAWEEEEWGHDSWSMKNDHYAQGGNKRYNGEYGAKQGHFGPRKEFTEYHHEERKRTPMWEFKSIVD